MLRIGRWHVRNHLQIPTDDAGVSSRFDATCLTATGGGKVSVTVTNSGTALHNFSVTSLGIDQDVAAGATITVNVKLPDSGTLGFFCKYHSASGMVGAFVIQ